VGPVLEAEFAEDDHAADADLKGTHAGDHRVAHALIVVARNQLAVSVAVCPRLRNFIVQSLGWLSRLGRDRSTQLLGEIKIFLLVVSQMNAVRLAVNAVFDHYDITELHICLSVALLDNSSLLLGFRWWCALDFGSKLSISHFNVVSNRLDQFKTRGRSNRFFPQIIAVEYFAALFNTGNLSLRKLSCWEECLTKSFAILLWVCHAFLTISP